MCEFNPEQGPVAYFHQRGRVEGSKRIKLDGRSNRL